MSQRCWGAEILVWVLSGWGIASCTSAPAQLVPQAGRGGAETVQAAVAGSGGNKSTVESGDIEVVRATATALRAPAIGESDYGTFLAHLNKFGLDLGQAFTKTENLTTKNLVYSPLSAGLALSMAYAGARGQTAREMKLVLGDTFSGETFHEGCNRLMQQLASRTRPGDSAMHGKIDIAFANSQFVDRRLTPKADFLQLLAAAYDSGVRRVDFATDAERARKVINTWVEQQTHDTIPDLLPVDSVDAGTRLVLVNALYFYASWQEPFAHAGGTGAFTTLSGKSEVVPVLRATRALNHAETDELALVEVPYADDKLRMTLVLPKPGQFEAVRAKVSLAWLDELTGKLSAKSVNIQLPKFRFTVDTFSLKDGLKALGMKDAFEDAADFTGISDEKLMISGVLQKSFISVDEDGTEAAAATAVVFAGTSAPSMVVPFTIDRPFLFFIRDGGGAILFSGHVVDPSH